MKAKFSANYTSRTGVPMTRFTVHGTEEEIAAFKVAQGEYYRPTDDGTGHVFTCPGTLVLPEYELGISRKGKVFLIDPIRQQANVVAQYGGNLGQAIADKAAAQVLIIMPHFKGMPVPEAQVPNDGADLGKM